MTDRIYKIVKDGKHVSSAGWFTLFDGGFCVIPAHEDEKINVGNDLKEFERQLSTHFAFLGKDWDRDITNFGNPCSFRNGGSQYSLRVTLKEFDGMLYCNGYMVH